MGSFAGLSIPRYCFMEGAVIKDNKNIACQLHGFCDASNQALYCKVYLKCTINGRSCVTFCAEQGQSCVGESNSSGYFTKGAGVCQDVHEVDVVCVKIVAASLMQILFLVRLTSGFKMGYKA